MNKLKSDSFTVQGLLFDVVAGKKFPASISIENGIISRIEKLETSNQQLILPGLIDAHVHIESSMLIPSEFARLAVRHGTVATVSDPHEIANVMGLEGVEYMLKNSRKVPFKFYFGAPSCVPATEFETSGATLGIKEVDQLLALPEIKYLSEMMNFPAVLAKDSMVLDKIACALKRNKPVDGHAPGLLGEAARNYAMAGISSDHECTTEQEARDKINAGMKIIIREGSAARNFDALINLLKEFPKSIMFCTDDKHPDQLVNYHIDDHIKRALELGIDEFSVIRAATLNPVRHYNLDVGLLQVGDPADFIIVDSLKNFKVSSTYINGIKVAENGISRIEHVPEIAINNFNCKKIELEDIQIKLEKTNIPDLIRVIEVLDGQLITNEVFTKARIEDGAIISDSLNDILKIVVVNRYHPAKPAVAFVKNFGFKHGAIASSVAHDSHNIIAVGVDDQDIADAINLIINEQGGISLVSKDEKKILPLPVAGLMSNTDGYQVAKKYEELDLLAKNLGSKLKAPFMSLSFMALLVIPKLKLSDLGLFDGERFKFTGLY